MEEKCFCHLNGYKVKDADARNNIEILANKISTLEGNVDENLGKELRKNHIWIFNPYSLSIYFGNESVITKTTESYLTEINKIVEEMREDSVNGNIPKLLIVNTTNGTLLFFHDGYMSNSATTITFNCTGVLSGLGEFVGTNMGLVQDANKQITSITFSKTANYLTTSSNFKFTPYNDYNPVHKKYVDDAIKNLDISESITLDTTPTENSTNGVTSCGVKSYVDGKLGDLEGVPVKTYLDGLEEDVLLAHNMVHTFASTNMRTLVWENTDNTTSLGETTITLTPYYDENEEIIPITHIEVIYLNGGSQALFSSGLIPLVNGIKKLRLEGVTSNKLSFREITLNDDLLGATLHNGRIVNTYGSSDASGIADSGSVCIPVRIYATYTDIPTLEGEVSE